MTGDAWAAVITAAGAFVTAMAGAFVLILKALRDVQRDTSQINRAVNHVDPGEPTLIERQRQQDETLAELKQLIAEHTEQDATNFQQIREHIERSVPWWRR